jgi:hypothetical protein
MRTRFPAVLSQCAQAQQTAGVLPGQLTLFQTLKGTTAAQFAQMWPALRLKSGRCSSWLSRQPLKRRRQPPRRRAQRGDTPVDYCCHMPGNESYVNFITQLSQLVDYRNRGWRCAVRQTGQSRYCDPERPQAFSERMIAAAADGTYLGASRIEGLFDARWLSGGEWAPPRVPPTHSDLVGDDTHVTGVGQHPLLSGRLYTLLCKAPNRPLDWCCHMPGNYSYVNFVQDEVTLVRYLNAGWKCEPRATSRSRECLAGWHPAVSLLQPVPTAPGLFQRPPIGVTPPPPGAPGGPAAQPVNLRCHPKGQPWNYNLVQDTITLQRYLAQGWVCDPA